MAEIGLNNLKSSADLVKAVANTQKEDETAGLGLASSLMKDPNPQKALTSYTVSDILQGVPLFKPKGITSDSFNQELSKELEDLRADFKTGGFKEDSRLNPFDIFIGNVRTNLKDGLGSVVPTSPPETTTSFNTSTPTPGTPSPAYSAGAIDLVSILRSHPLTKTLQIEDGRANERGTLKPIGVLNHHTASSPGQDAPSLGIVQNGRSDLAGPLCNLLGTRSGRIVVISNGIANHAGKGDPNVIKRIQSGAAPLSNPGPDQSSAGGNTALIGIEWENSGLGEPWSSQELDAMYRVNAALCDTFGWDPHVAVIAHSEWTKRKIDPAFVSPKMTMQDVRVKTAALMSASTVRKISPW